MKVVTYSALLLLAVFVAAGCSGEGDTIVDPDADKRAQSSLFAVESEGAGELYRYSELDGSMVQNEYAAVNGAALGRKIDAVFEDRDRLFLHHREDGAITVLDLTTRRKTGTIEGFPTKAEGTMCSMAFSNLSQAWVVCYGSKNLYQVDAVNSIIADTIPMPAYPTVVATLDTFVFVCMEMPDGTGQIGVFKSNSGGVFTFDRIIPVASPVYFATASTYGTDVIFMTAGIGTGVKPRTYYLIPSTLEMRYDVEYDLPAMTSFIGKEPNFIAFTELDNTYLALPDRIVQIFNGGYPFDWLPGNYEVIGADPASDLLYAYTPGSFTVKRRTAGGEDLPDLSITADVRSIFFLGTNRVK